MNTDLPASAALECFRDLVFAFLHPKLLPRGLNILR